MAAPLEGTLLILTPDLTDMGLAPNPLALVGRGKVHEDAKKHTRSLSLRPGPVRKASTFIMEGTAASCGLRYKDGDPALQRMTLDAWWGTAKSKVGQGMGLHANLDHPEWVQQFKFYTDEGLIGPAPRADNPLCAGLCIGIDPDADTPAFIMVERTDARRRVTFGGTLMEQAAAHAEKVAAAFPATLPGSDSIVLIVKHPPMPWLGSGQKAVIMSGGVHELEGGKAWAKLGIGSALDAVEFVADGEPEKMRLRLQCKKMATLDYAHGTGKTAPGQDVNCYGDPEHPDWCPSSRFGDDGTIGPLIHGNNPMAAQCCLGYHRGANGVTSIKMVKRDDPKRLIFGSAHDMEGFIADLVAQRAAVAAAAEQLKTDAIAACNDERKAQLKHDGFTKFEGGIPRHLVLNAMREINREIGLSSTTTDQFKAKTFANHPDIANLIKQSMAPHICAALMGGTPDYYRNQIGGGQLALRFPGDMCDDGKATCSAERFAGVAKGWHIDGCANEFIPGTTDRECRIVSVSLYTNSSFLPTLPCLSVFSLLTPNPLDTRLRDRAQLFDADRLPFE